MGARQARPRIAPVLVAGCLGAVSVAVPNAAWTQQSDTETTAEETTVDDVQAEFSDAFDTIGDYSAEQRDEALARMEVTLARLDERIEETETRVREEWAGMSEATQERTSAALSALREQRNGLSEAYGALSQGAGTAWGDLMDGVQTGWSDLASAWDDATLAISNDNETGD
ncbi:MAG: SF-assemblin/beta giardin [Rhodobacteraceae bacterium HLUCCO18]|nr:MAG: SF-assemblin/beta giardin [Rhodobacteraceae bacterium HLUCCO18]